MLLLLWQARIDDFVREFFNKYVQQSFFFGLGCGFLFVELLVFLFILFHIIELIRFLTIVIFLIIVGAVIFISVLLFL